jgi:hypothetical protein
VEKIPVIHSSGSVYYHYYPYFLSKLTKEGKVPKLRLAAKPVRRERRFVCKKKKVGTVATKPDANAARLLSCLQKERDADVASRPAFASCKRPAGKQNQLDCGQGAVYPQHQMCKTAVFSARRVFVQHRFGIDTMLVQPLRYRVNR